MPYLNQVDRLIEAAERLTWISKTRSWRCTIIVDDAPWVFIVQSEPVP
jgi:hypothetical protein